MKILYFIGTLCTGGKERRLIELMSGLKGNTDIEILLILAFNQIDYEYFYNLNIDYVSIDKRPNKKSIKVFFQLDKIIKNFKPDIIHTWGSMQTFYMLPSSILRKIPLINSQITNAPLIGTKRSLFQRFINNINLRTSTINLANSYAGLKSYSIENNKNSRVIHNGFNMNRIKLLEDSSKIRKQLNIKTKYVVCMVGAFSDRKDYETYLTVAEKIIKNRNDISFLGIGSGYLLEKYRKEYERFKRIILPGRMSDVESIINVSDICVLMTSGNVHGEGISNSIMEYMALGKPIVASDSGGTSEIVQNNKTGFIIPDKSYDELKTKIHYLLSNKKLRDEMGNLGKKRISDRFNIDLMLFSFLDLYNDVRKSIRNM